MPDSSMAEQAAVNRKVVGSTPTLAVSFVRVVGISAVQLAFNQHQIGSTPIPPIISTGDRKARCNAYNIAVGGAVPPRWTD